MNVLIVRPDGIGDLVFSLPVATQLRQLMPGVRLGALANPVAAPILEHHPDIDYVRTVSLQASISDMVQVFSGGIDAVILAAALNVPRVSLFDPRRNNLRPAGNPWGVVCCFARMCRLVKRVSVKPASTGIVWIASGFSTCRIMWGS